MDVSGHAGISGCDEDEVGGDIAAGPGARSVGLLIGVSSHQRRIKGVDLNKVTVAQMKMVAESYVGCDLYDRPRMMTSAFFIRICAKNERTFPRY